MKFLITGSTGMVGRNIIENSYISSCQLLTPNSKVWIGSYVIAIPQQLQIQVIGQVSSLSFWWLCSADISSWCWSSVLFPSEQGLIDKPRINNDSMIVINFIGTKINKFQCNGVAKSFLNSVLGFVFS